MPGLFKVNRQGVNQLLRGPEASSACREACQRTAATAGARIRTVRRRSTAAATSSTHPSAPSRWRCAKAAAPG